MMPAEPVVKPEYAMTFHRDGTVSYWDVFEQQWRRGADASIPDAVLASMNNAERYRIEMRKLATSVSSY
jgi:hypothetical protein